MDGIIAISTRIPSNALRGSLVSALCAALVILVGAAREPKPDDHNAAAASDAARSEDSAILASYSTAPANTGLLVERPRLSVPTVAEARAALERVSEALLPSIAERPLIPQLAPRVPSGAGARSARLMLMEVTAYCACRKCCGPKAQGITASGRPVSFNGGKFVAADTKVLKFNTKLVIPGYAGNRPVQVIDRGGAIKGNKLDVYFPTHQEAREWGRRKMWVTVLDE
jgi:3D (Asp-Asp-Asp) domain-containing protein